MEHRFIIRDERVVWIRNEAHLRRDEDGNPLYWQGYWLDVTSEKEANDALRLREEWYQRLIQSASDVITVVDREGIIQFKSSSSLSVLGHAPEQYIGQRIIDMVHPDDRDRIVAAFVESIGHPDGDIAVECRIEDAEGNWCWMDVTARNLLDDPAINGIVINARDITDRKQAEAALAAAEQHYRAIIENIPIVTYSEDTATGAIYTSPQIEELTGCTSEQWSVDLAFSLDRTHPDDRDMVVAEIARTDATGDPFCLEYRFIHRDGRTVWVRNEAILIRNDDGTPRHWQGFILDITAQKGAEQLLLLSEQRHRALVQGASDVIAVIAEGGEFGYVSPSVTALLGYYGRELRGQPVTDYIHSDDHHDVAAAIANLRANPEQTARVEFRFRHHDGQWR